MVGTERVPSVPDLLAVSKWNQKHFWMLTVSEEVKSERSFAVTEQETSNVVLELTDCRQSVFAKTFE